MIVCKKYQPLANLIRCTHTHANFDLIQCQEAKITEGRQLFLTGCTQTYTLIFHLSESDKAIWTPKINIWVLPINLCVQQRAFVSVLASTNSSLLLLRLTPARQCDIFKAPILHTSLVFVPDSQQSTPQLNSEKKKKKLSWIILWCQFIRVFVYSLGRDHSVHVLFFFYKSWWGGLGGWNIHLAARVR